jgi:sec-independent protein translocase protein TatA
MGSMSIVHWMIVIGVVVLLFGRNKISDLMGDVAQGIKSFKKGMREDEPVATERGERGGEREHGSQSEVSTSPPPVSTKVSDRV